MKGRKNIITVAIDSPAAAGAGTQAKLISKHYNLFYLDTGKIYRYIGNLKLKFGTKFSYNLVKHSINTLNLRKLKNNYFCKKFIFLLFFALFCSFLLFFALFLNNY